MTLLLLGAHADDIEIGCGGTVLDLLASADDVDVRWIVFSAEGQRAEEARRSAARFLAGARRARVTLHEFRDGFFPYEGAALKEKFEALKADFGIPGSEFPDGGPDFVFTHRRDDLHQDHRVIAELTWNTFRGHTILEYEIPKYDGDLGSPNMFVPLPAAIRNRKIELLMECFPSQREKRWFTEETFRGLMRLRANECPEACDAAEAFHARKLVMRLAP